MHDVACVVLQKFRKNGGTISQCGDANAAYKINNSFKFSLILQIMKEIIRILIFVKIYNKYLKIRLMLGI